jgi:hypothetical protein
MPPLFLQEILNPPIVNETGVIKLTYPKNVPKNFLVITDY